MIKISRFSLKFVVRCCWYKFLQNFATEHACFTINAAKPISHLPPDLYVYEKTDKIQKFCSTFILKSNHLMF